MKANELLNKLKEINKAYYTVGNIQILVKQPKEAVRVLVSRLVKNGELNRLMKDVYVLREQIIDYEKIAEQLDQTSYISFESALTRYNILNQVPYILTLATAKKSKTLDLGGQTVVFRKIKPELSGGLILENNLRLAMPEKALLDLIYLIVRGKVKQSLDELDLSVVDEKVANDLAEKYPKKVKEILLSLFEKNK